MALRLLLTGIILSLAIVPLAAFRGSPAPVRADECILGEDGGGVDTAILVVRFREGSAGGPQTSFTGFRATISPNPVLFNHTGVLTADDNGINDDDNDFPETGAITIDDACQTDHPGFPSNYTLTASIIPGSAAAVQGCQIPVPVLANVAVTGSEGAVREVVFVVSCLGPVPPAGFTAGPAPGAPAPAAPPPAAPAAVAAAPSCRPGQAGAAASAGPVVFEVSATGDQVLPPVASAGRVFARFTYDPATRELDYSATLSGLAPAAITGAAIHFGAPGENGPWLHTLATGGFTSIAGTIVLPDENQVLALAYGDLYLLFTSSTHPQGFARAQLPAAGAAALAGCVPPVAPSVSGATAAPGSSAPPTGLRIQPPSTGSGGLR